MPAFIFFMGSAPLLPFSSGGDSLVGIKFLELRQAKMSPRISHAQEAAQQRVLGQLEAGGCGALGGCRNKLSVDPGSSSSHSWTDRP